MHKRIVYVFERPPPLPAPFNLYYNIESSSLPANENNSPTNIGYFGILVILFVLKFLCLIFIITYSSYFLFDFVFYFHFYFILLFFNNFEFVQITL